MLDERDNVVDNKPIQEVDNVEIGEVVIDKIRSKNFESAFVIETNFEIKKTY